MRRVGGGREGGGEGRREGGRERKREGGREREREGGREGGRERRREARKKIGRERGRRKSEAGSDRRNKAGREVGRDRGILSDQRVRACVDLAEQSVCKQSLEACSSWRRAPSKVMYRLCRVLEGLCRSLKAAVTE